MHDSIFRWSAQGSPYLDYTTDNEGNIIDAQGFLIDVLMDMKRSLNFTTKSISGTDNTWGSQDGSGKWYGLVGRLASQEVDISSPL